MQLKIQRSQRAGGVLGGTVLFCLDVRADYTSQEADNVRKYKLGSQVIYNSQAARKHLDRADAHLERTQSGSAGERAAGLARGAYSLVMANMSLNISIGSLGKGHHIECKDLEELLAAEETVRNACKNVTRYLDVAESFDGSEVVIEYANGEERVHIEQNAPPLLEYQPNASGSPQNNSDVTPDVAFDVGRWFGQKALPAKKLWNSSEDKAVHWLNKFFPLLSTKIYRYLIRAIAAIILLLVLFEVF